MDGPSERFEAEPDDTRAAIMKATYEALLKHGYADLTIQRIGDEFAKSKSLLYHHYESKDALLVDFMAFMLEVMEEAVPVEEGETADEKLQVVIDHVFENMLAEDDDFMHAMIELRAQAVHDEAFRESFTKNDEFITDRVREIIADGVAEGTFRDVDPDRAATMFLTFIQGAMFSHATTENADLDVIRGELETYLDLNLLGED
ncbi:MAG: TetR/AcrR family transcriptional regulator [Haloarculaceae archaeon]